MMQHIFLLTFWRIPFGSLYIPIKWSVWSPLYIYKSIPFYVNIHDELDHLVEANPDFLGNYTTMWFSRCHHIMWGRGKTYYTIFRWMNFTSYFDVKTRVAQLCFIAIHQVSTCLAEWKNQSNSWPLPWLLSLTAGYGRKDNQRFRTFNNDRCTTMSSSLPLDVEHLPETRV